MFSKGNCVLSLTPNELAELAHLLENDEGFIFYLEHGEGGCDEAYTIKRVSITDTYVYLIGFKKETLEIIGPMEDLKKKVHDFVAVGLATCNVFVFAADIKFLLDRMKNMPEAGKSEGKSYSADEVAGIISKMRVDEVLTFPTYYTKGKYLRGCVIRLVQLGDSRNFVMNFSKGGAPAIFEFSTMQAIENNLKKYFNQYKITSAYIDYGRELEARK